MPQTATGKRKRKSLEGTHGHDGEPSDGEAGGSGSDAGRAPAQVASTPSAADAKKRTKTQRACDSCRSRKIRFVYWLYGTRFPLPSLCSSCIHFESILSFWQSLRVLVQHHLTFVLCDRCDILPDSEPPFCQHCKQYGFDCTFFLPIAETRFKKKKLEEELLHMQVPKRDPWRGVSLLRLMGRLFATD